MQARRSPPGSRPPAPRSRRAGRPPSRRDCGSRSSRSGTRPRRKATDLCLCSDVQSAFLPRSILNNGPSFLPAQTNTERSRPMPDFPGSAPESGLSPHQPNFLHIEINRGLRTRFCVSRHNFLIRRPSSRSAPLHVKTLESATRRHDSRRQFRRLRATRWEGQVLTIFRQNFRPHGACTGCVRRKAGKTAGSGRGGAPTQRHAAEATPAHAPLFLHCRDGGFAHEGNRL